MQQLTEAEAWRTIGEAFEAKAAHPTFDVGSRDIAVYGLCAAASTLTDLGQTTLQQMNRMVSKVWGEVDSPENQARAGYETVMLHPKPGVPGGLELRATLAYLFAEEAGA